MASVQAGLVMFFMRKLKSRAIRLMTDLPKLRVEKERVMGRVKVPFRVRKTSFSIDSINAAKFEPLKNRHPHKVVLYLHGGGYAAGSIKSHQGLIGKLALETGITHIAIDYRLAPEHPYPAALDDAILAYNWLLERQFYTTEDIIIMGDSAGGGLALATLLKLKDLGKKQPLAAVALSPWTDLTVSGDSALSEPEKDPLLDVYHARECGLWYAGKASNLKCPLVSPLYGDLNDLAPMLLHVGTEEILLSDSVRFATNAAFTNTKVELDIYDDLPHVFHFCWQYLPEAKEAISKIAQFIDSQIEEQEGARKQSLSAKTVALAELSWSALKFGKSKLIGS